MENGNRTARKTSKREAIMDAAIELFSCKGYHNTRMEEIAIKCRGRQRYYLRVLCRQIGAFPGDIVYWMALDPGAHTAGAD